MTTITELSNELEIMEKRLEVFKKLKVNHKIMEDTHNHALYSIAPGYFQSWARWWQGENQKKTYEPLDIYIDDFRVHEIHYGDPKIINKLIWLPYLEIIFFVFFILIAFTVRLEGVLT